MEQCHEYLYAFMSKEVNKLTALKALGDSLPVSLEEMTVFGDDLNDIEILQGCGLSYK